MTGYISPGYAESLAEFGIPRELPECGGWILQRQIPGLSDFDAMGCYPLFACRDWSKLDNDLGNIGSELISLAVVTDPFGNYTPADLHKCFQHIAIPFKEHFIVDLHQPIKSFVCEHHRRYARKVMREIEVEKCQEPANLIDEWVNLYTTLIERHKIKGISVFSKLSFAKQLKLDGMVMFRAVHQNTTVGMTLWYVQNDVGYYHLGAYSQLGYELRSSFALFWFAIEYFAAIGLRWLNLGAGAGIKASGTDGLSRFKQGWSTGTRTAYFCGRIFDKERYSEILQLKGVFTTDYFPPYRKGEF